MTWPTFWRHVRGLLCTLTGHAFGGGGVFTVGQTFCSRCFDDCEPATCRTCKGRGWYYVSGPIYRGDYVNVSPTRRCFDCDAAERGRSLSWPGEGAPK